MAIRGNKTIIAFMFLTPVVVVLVLAVFIPIGSAIYWSFYQLMIRGQEGVYVGLGNYLHLFSSEWFWTAFRNTVFFTLYSTGGQFLVGLGVALLLNQDIKFRGLFRGIALIPWVIPSVVAATIWLWLYDAVWGLFNYFLFKVGLISDYVIFLSAKNAFLSVTFANIWKGFPFLAVILLAGLQAIPNQLYEAAKVDGAGTRDSFLHITLPSIRPMIVLSLLLSTLTNFRYFTLIFTMTEGGPGKSTEVLVTHLYKLAFRHFRFGQASAVGGIMALFLLVFAILYLNIMRRTGEI